jgi:hypothetical protein
MDEPIAESDLVEAFNRLKSDRNRAFLNLDDFRAALLRYQPEVIREEL